MKEKTAKRSSLPGMAPRTEASSKTKDSTRTRGPRQSSGPIIRRTQHQQSVENPLEGVAVRRSGRLSKRRLPTFSTSVATCSTAEYQPLDLARRQIRILHLMPGNFEDPIHTTLSLAYLEDHPQYEALSYVWGDPNVCMSITVNGKDQLVTTNLWAALRRCRLTITIEYLGFEKGFPLPC